ncbi:D-ribose pyranase [Eubacteriales bacterium OttesenSCG-928-N13]|nr:D-ribose pyranase [Eubacteriales bacterium OttesenSCG-928-N13]
MRKTGLLQAEIVGALAALGHTQTIVIGDAGLPIPDGVPMVDLALRAGIPTFWDTLETLLPECVFESYVMASETEGKNLPLLTNVREALSPMSETLVPHEEFKRMSESAQLIIRTGETSSFANIILVGGVNF